MSTPAILVDDSLWPLRQVKFTKQVTLVEYQAYLENFAATLRRRERYVGLFELNLSNIAPPREIRQMQAEWLERHEQLISEYLRGVAFIITSPMTRLILSTVFYFKAFPAPYTITPHRSEAMDWVMQRLHQERLHGAIERIQSLEQPIALASGQKRGGR